MTTATDLSRQRRLARYARYRASVKGWQRTMRYNLSQAHRDAAARYRATHARGEQSYQLSSGLWTNLSKVSP
jgi:hypothetical protein